MMSSMAGSSPLTRGARVRQPRPYPRRGLIPAHAGSTQMTYSFWSGRGAHPRSRGEHAASSSNFTVRPGSSPLTRGAREMTCCSCVRVGLIPAHAGSTYSRTYLGRYARAHPRSRGEHAVSLQLCAIRLGSSPLTRGAPRGLRRRRTDLGLIPAHAGSTPHRGFWLRRLSGSSPLTRGALVVHGVPRLRCGLIPAHAGSTCSYRTRTGASPAHPRSRGEHSFIMSPGILVPGSSPLTRGALPREVSQTWPVGLIPAHAGSTVTGSTAKSSRGAHPRSRGEHEPFQSLPASSFGSSPLTRGAHRAQTEHAQARRLIPAHAGSTWRQAGRGRG